MVQVGAGLMDTARARAGLAAAERRIEHGRPEDAAREVLSVIQELTALHGTLMDAHVALSRQEQARTQLAQDYGLQAVIERNRRSGLVPIPPPPVPTSQPVAVH